jgi:solute carrier family 25 carnitine/acylcarnitine transporter 20/29
MASPLIGIAAVNSLLFAAYGTCKRAISPFGELTLPQTAAAGAGAGAINAVLASPVGSAQHVSDMNS